MLRQVVLAHEPFARFEAAALSVRGMHYLDGAQLSHEPIFERLVAGLRLAVAEWISAWRPTGDEPDAAKRIFVRPLHAHACLSRPVLDPQYRPGARRIMLSAEHMGSLPEFFADIPDPRRGQGRRHPRPAVLAIAAAATRCGMRGYKAISLWAEDLGRRREHAFAAATATVATRCPVAP